MRVLGWLVVAVFLTIPTATLARTARAPRMTPAQAIGLVKAAGFRLVHGHVENRCGKVVNPHIQFGDLNNDGRPEAYVVDVDPRCYHRPGAYYAVLTLDASGHWRRLIAEDAVVGFAHTRTDGWYDLVVKPGRGACPGKRHYQAGVYVTPCTNRHTSPPRVARTSARTRSGGYPTDGWKMPVTFAALSLAQQAAIMHVAGMKLVGGVWKGCDGSSEVDKNGVKFEDLNHDGRPEVVVVDGGTACYGNTGVGFTILRAVRGGWDVMSQGTGIPEFLKTHGAGGYPDILIGGPGGCFPVDRWDGRKYRFVGRHRFDGKRAGAACRL